MCNREPNLVSPRNAARLHSPKGGLLHTGVRLYLCATVMGKHKKHWVRKTGVENHSYKHGQCRAQIYHIWGGMIDRCYNPISPYYHHYGGRGIKVCDSWRDFNNFYADMGDVPEKGLSLDRIDTNGIYEPSNCRWANVVQQNRNRRNNTRLSCFGVTKCLEEWAIELGIDSRTLSWRKCQGWPDEKILTTPLRKNRRTKLYVGRYTANKTYPLQNTGT